MIEENVIGLSIKGEIDPLTTGLKPENFSSLHYQKAWRAIIDIRSRNAIADLLTTTDRLEKLDPTFNWLAMLGDCANNTMPVRSADQHIDQIKQNWINSQIKNIGYEIISSSELDLNSYIKQLMQLNQTSKKYLHSYAEAADDALNEIEKTMSGETRAIPTGFHDIDKITGGLHGSDLIIVAARSAMGKTAFLLNMAAANKNSPLVFSTEQSRIQAMWRNFSIMGGVPNHLIRTGELNNEQFGRMSNAIESINSSGGWIYDKSGPYIDEIETTAREVYQNHGCSAIYLDYLQRIKHRETKMPRHEQVGDVAMRLKELARELNIPVVALAQVNRTVEARQNKRPGMGDIKDSGMIEQEADSILTLYRDEVYNENTPDRGICEVDFKKNRHGGTGCIRLKWDAPTMKFNDLAKMQF